MHGRGVAMAVMAGSIFLAGSAQAQQSAAAIPPDVKQALDRMGTALRALTSFELKADVTTEDVLVTNQKLQNAAVMTFDVRRPNRMFVDVDSPRKHRQLYYDGQHFTVYGPSTGYYATVDAPGTLAAMLKEADAKYGIEMPMADLFQWGTSAFPLDRIQSAMAAGTDVIDGRTCNHFAFRQPNVDWQIWIDRADPALPCKLVIVNTADPAQPTTTAVYSWTTGAPFADAQFRFDPPASGQHIVLGQITSGKGGK